MVELRDFQFDLDYEAAVLLWKNAGKGIGIGPSDQPEEILKKVQHDNDLFLVAHDNGKLVGTVIGGFDGRRGMIYHLAVDNNYQNHGLGTRLMQEIENRLKAKGCLKAYLLVKNENTSVSDFYLTRGWYEMTDVHLFGKTFK